jgi:hypothetical protein
MPGTRRIFAGVSGSPGSVHALRQAAHLAHHHDALLIPVPAWLPPDSRRLPWPEPLLPGPRPLLGAGHPSPLPGPAGRPRPARLGVPAPLGPGSSPARLENPPPCPPAQVAQRVSVRTA